MCFYTIHGRKFAELEHILDPHVRYYFHCLIENHHAFSYNGDWFATWYDLPVEGKMACTVALERVNLTGADPRAIPKVEAQFFKAFGLRNHFRRIVCAFNAIDENGMVRLMG